MEKHIYDFSYMPISMSQFYKCLADETRLNSVLLIESEKELCVCELSRALQVSQPKVSRHLAQLRQCGLLLDRREGQWVFYKINPELPDWARKVISTTFLSNQDYVNVLLDRLKDMDGRPAKFCC